MNNTNYKKDFNSDIPLDELFEILKRRKNIFFIVFFISLISSIIYAYTTKPTYQGEFQIVLRKKNPNESYKTSLLSSLDTSNFLSLLGGNSSSPNLNTEVTILQSPYVLRPIFEFVRDQKFDKDSKKYQKYSFNSWEKKLDVNLEKGSAVLNIFYKDKDKNLILPVINKISDEYQKYSKLDTKKSLSKENNYLEKQIAIFQEKSNESIKKLDYFSKKNNIYLKDFKTSTAENDKDSFSKLLELTTVSEDIIKEELFNIEKNKSLINSLNELDVNLNYIFLKNIFSKERENPSLKELDELNNKIIKSKIIYKENDKEIKKLQSNFEIVVNNLKNEYIEFLNQDILRSEKFIKNQKRSDKDIFRFKELARDVIRDNATLASLENQYQLTSLELARELDPWELITKPTLDEIPISPKKKIVAFFGMVSGILFGFLFSIIRDKFTGIIYNKKNLTNLIPYRFLSIIDIKKEESSKLKFNFIFKNLNDEFPDGKIKLLKVGNISKEKIEFLKRRVIKNNKNIIYEENLSPSFSYQQIICLEIGSIKYDDLQEFIELSKLQKNPIFGYVIFN